MIGVVMQPHLLFRNIYLKILIAECDQSGKQDELTKAYKIEKTYTYKNTSKYEQEI